MTALRAAALMAVLLSGGCAATGSHLDARGRCEAPGPSGAADSNTRALWYLFCIQSP